MATINGKRIDEGKATAVLLHLSETSFKALPAKARRAYFAKLTSGKVKGGKVYPKNKAGNRVKPTAKGKAKTFDERLSALPRSGGDKMSGTFTIGKARYAKNKVAIRTPSNDNFKTRAARLIGDGIGAKWSNREKAYIASPAQAEKFVDLLGKGYSGNVIYGGITPPK